MASAVTSRLFARSAASVTRFSSRSSTQCLRLRATQQQCKPLALTRSFTASPKPWEKRYTDDHEWVELSEDGQTGTIGISEYAAKALGDVVYVELPQADLQVSAGDSIGAVESVKSASDIMTPISGTIIEANGTLENTPGTINQSPEKDGWLAKIRVADKSEVEKLKNANEYKKFTEEADDH